MEVLTKLWRIDIDGKLELEIDMVHKMFKRKNIWDSYDSSIMCEHWCELMLQWWMYYTHASPFPLELIYNGIMDQHRPLLIKGLFSKIVLHAWFNLLFPISWVPSYSF